VNTKINDFVGYILQNRFYACFYILLSGARPKHRCTHSYLRRGFATLGATGAEPLCC